MASGFINLQGNASGLAINLDNSHKGISLLEDWTGDAVGVLRWLDADASGGISATSLVAASANHPGILELNTDVSATGQAARYLGGVTAGACTAGFIAQGGSITVELMIMVPVLSGGGQTFNINVGLSDGAITANNTIRFAFLNTTSLTNWLGVTSNGGTSTTLDTGVAVVAGAWTKLKFVSNAAGTEVLYFINDALVGSISTNIPTVTIAPSVRMVKNGGVTPRACYIDYYSISQTLNVVR